MMLSQLVLSLGYEMIKNVFGMVAVQIIHMMNQH